MKLEYTSDKVEESQDWELWKSAHLGTRGAAPSRWSLRRKSDGKVLGFDTKKRAMDCANYSIEQVFEKVTTRA